MSWEEFKKKKKHDIDINEETLDNKEEEKNTSSWQRFKEEKERLNNTSILTSKDNNKKTILEDSKENTFFKKSNFFYDGYQFGDIAATAAVTAADVGLNAAKGLAKIGEGLGDTVSYGIADIIEKKGNRAKADAVRKRAQENTIESFFSPAEEKIDKLSVLGEKSDSIAEGLGYVAGITSASIVRRNRWNCRSNSSKYSYSIY